jgi:hypothetical protein
MQKRPEGTKLILVITDGCPDASSPPIIKNVIQKGMHTNTPVICVGIGSDTEKLRELYGERFFEVNQLDELPTKMLRVVKRFVRFV